MRGTVAIIWLHDKRQPPMNQAIKPPEFSSAVRVHDEDRTVVMGRQVLEIEAAAVAALGRRLGSEFRAAVTLILASWLPPSPAPAPRPISSMPPKPCMATWA